MKWPAEFGGVEPCALEVVGVEERRIIGLIRDTELPTLASCREIQTRPGVSGTLPGGGCASWARCLQLKIS